MIKLINRLTGGEMWVSEERVEEYKAAGYKPAANALPEEPREKPKPKPKAKAKTKTKVK